ncbi:F-box protein At5g49610-like [Brachypodium distachyon]|uniref:F-box domain-containing protein n=1 Tax=Brachypodium distachyon TaxID=15368 RepID=I1IJG4_BRADI|nr:F-box protein At5g49610-like [Brachypodium distachyon]KQJ87313.1 hypothetical protein BRADI_4g10320v3 [Brachypodium distachyon]|eukprot:XP_024310295.1 F-box protein At5g49610-like [Brachypodium distachyon]
MAAYSEPVAWRTRGRRRQAAAIAVLHPDVLIWEILARLPAATLLRCRAVCRAWSGIPSDPGFLLAHHCRQPSLPLFVLRESSTDAANPDRGRPLLGLDRRHLDGYVGVGPFALHASCDGLLLVSHRRRFTICNPATRQHAPVPGLDAAGSCTKVEALYPHRPSGEYRVLYWHDDQTKNNGDEVCCYILGVPRARKRCSVPIVPAACLGIACAVMQCSHCSRPPPVMFRGCLHWDPPRHRPSGGASLVFDTVAESFRPMRLPDAAGCCTRLHDMEGLLGLSCFDDSSTVAKLWVLEDYEREVWSLKHKINFSSVSTCNIAKESRHLVLSHEGDMLLYRNSSSKEGDMPSYSNSRSSYMVHSAEGKFLEEFQ